MSAAGPLRVVDVDPQDVLPGDIASHVSGELDPRPVAGADHARGVVRLDILGSTTGDLPLSNYTYRRFVRDPHELHPGDHVATPSRRVYVFDGAATLTHEGRRRYWLNRPPVWETYPPGHLHGQAAQTVTTRPRLLRSAQLATARMYLERARRRPKDARGPLLELAARHLAAAAARGVDTPDELDAARGALSSLHVLPIGD